MADGPETRLVKAITRAILSRWPDAYVIKVHGNPYQQAGTPDLLVVIAGRLTGIEVKYPRPGESREARERRVSARQRAEIARLRRAGAVAGMADSVEEALALIEETLNIDLTLD